MRLTYSTLWCLLAVCMAAWTAAAQYKRDARLTIRELHSPASAPSGEPNLYASPDGRFYLSWLEARGEKLHALRFAVYGGAGWAEPRTIAEGENWFVNWADFPSLIASKDGSLLAHWLVRSGPDTYAYDVTIARSADGGVTWGKPVIPHRDGTKTEHGFVSMLPLSEGRAMAVWLDGRKFKGGSHDSHGASTDDMSLRQTIIDSRGRPAEDQLLDPRVCECCQTSAALSSAGAIVAYRDRSEKEVRDISVVRFVNGRWTQPKRVHADGWEIHGCPVNGPAVSAFGRKVAIAWFTAANDAPRVQVGFSGDGGANFAKPIRVDNNKPLGRVDLEILEDGSALVLWLEQTAGGADVRLRRVWPDGSHSDAITVAASSAARASGFPRLARSGGKLLLAWTEPGTPSRIRIAVGMLTR